MPELPEVESLRRILAAEIVGRRLVEVSVVERRLRRTLAEDFADAVAGRTVVAVGRRAKYLLIELDRDATLMVHLGMSGSLTIRTEAAGFSGLDSRHDHVRFVLDNGAFLVYNDPRRFGLMKLLTRAELAATQELKEIGPEPFGTDLNCDYLWQVSRGRTAAIKNLLMDQRIVAGVGNIYASEILFRAGVRPTRRAGKVTRAETARIAAIIPQVLHEAIGRGGTTFRSYLDGRGQPGRYAERLQVYDRAGKPCLQCATAIRAIVIGQRSSFYCPRCQR
jgi:formamidopyrimidine-DNA glycosylase